MASSSSVSSNARLGSEGFKLNTDHSSRKDRTRDITRLGPKEKEVLKRIIELGLVFFSPKDLGLNWDRRRVNDVLKRLMNKNLITRVARGLYKVLSRREIIRILINKPLPSLQVSETRKDSHETRSGAGSQESSHRVYPKRIVYVEGPFLDNLDAYTCSGKRVRGDRVDRELRELAFFDRVNYAEILYKAEGVEIFGSLVIYQKHGKVRIEWRPPSGFIKRNGIVVGLRMYWEMVLNAFKLLLHSILQHGPLDIKQRMIRAIVDAGLKTIICV
mgnify:CR=1 FL=1